MVAAVDTTRGRVCSCVHNVGAVSQRVNCADSDAAGSNDRRGFRRAGCRHPVGGSVAAMEPVCAWSGGYRDLAESLDGAICTAADNCQGIMGVVAAAVVGEHAVSSES